MSEPSARRRSRKPPSAMKTLADVATLAGVSTASVSRALNNEYGVSADMKRRVETAIRTLGWVPNGAAKALASQRTRIVGVLLPNLEFPKFGIVVEGLQLYLSARGYTLLIGCTEQKEASAMDQALKMVERGVECLVLVGLSQPPGLFPYLAERNIPSVITYTAAAPGVSQTPGSRIIGFDNKVAMEHVVEHLLSLGHRNFGCITIDSSVHNDRMIQRVEGAREALARQGIAIRPQHMIELPDSYIRSGRVGLSRMLESPDWPTAIVCTNDYFALGALFEALDRGIKVPEEMSIVGFDDIETGAHIHPGLTTVSVPNKEMGEAVAKYIVSLLEGETIEEPPPLDATLLIRESSGPAPVRA